MAFSILFKGFSSPGAPTDLPLLVRVPSGRSLAPPPAWSRTRAQFSSIQLILHPEHKSQVWTLTGQSLPAGPNFLQDLGGGGAGEEMVRVLEAVLGPPSLSPHDSVPLCRKQTTPKVAMTFRCQMDRGFISKLDRKNRREVRQIPLTGSRKSREVHKVSFMVLGS